MKRVVIGFCGPIGAGKTTAARVLTCDLGFVRVRFAETLKAMLAAFGLSPAEIDGHLKEQPCALLGGKTPRYAMQTLGTEWGRGLISSRLWEDRWLAAIEQTPWGSPIVADDVRFANEAAAIHSLGGVVIQVVREGTGGQATHASERLEFVPDFRLQNSDLDEFQRRVVALASARIELSQRDAA